MTLSERINGVMDEVKALEADQKHQQGYGYISANKILSRIGQAMVNNGLAIIPACLQHTTNLHTYTDSYGKEKMLWQVDAQMQMTITDNESEPMAVLWTGSGVDYASPDKALYKAMTSGHKYFIMKLFMVGVGNEDGEHEQREEISGRNVTTTRARAKQNGNGRKPVANGSIVDIRSSLEELKTFTLGIVADRAAMTEHYDNSHHALNAMKDFDFPDGVKVEMGQKVSKDGALSVFDWLMEHKRPLFENEGPSIEDGEMDAVWPAGRTS